jgi:hypothetical protein
MRVGRRVENPRPRQRAQDAGHDGAVGADERLEAPQVGVDLHARD